MERPATPDKVSRFSYNEAEPRLENVNWISRVRVEKRTVGSSNLRDRTIKTFRVLECETPSSIINNISYSFRYNFPRPFRWNNRRIRRTAVIGLRSNRPSTRIGIPCML